MLFKTLLRVNSLTCMYECNFPEFPCGMMILFAGPPIFTVKSQKSEFFLTDWAGG